MLKLRKMFRERVSQSGPALFHSSEELDRLSSSVLLNILCLLRNEGVPSILFVCLSVLLHISEGRMEALSPFESVLATVGRMVFLTFVVCTLEKRAEFSLGLSFLWFFFKPQKFQYW